MPTPREREMLHAARDSGITSRAELANFMAQISAESRNLTALEESFHYTRGIDQIPVRWARRDGDDALERARLDAVRGQPEALAELMYGARMGNDEPGDGYRYRGRGYIQLTGRDNYRAMGEALGLDLEHHPDLAAEPEHAARVAVTFWRQNVPVAAREDVLAATRRINGGTNGLAHRQAEYDRWHAVLTPEFLVGLEASRPDASIGRDEPAPREWRQALQQTLQHVVQQHPAPGASVMQGGLPGFLGPSGAADAAPPAPARPDLRQGARGTDVRELQQALDRLGIRDGQGRPLVADGIFGASTRQAVENFQLWNGLDTSGVVDRDTRERLHDPHRRVAAGHGGDAATPAGMQPAPDPRDPSHPDHAMYQRIRSGVQAIEERNGRPYDEASERVSRCLLAHCKGAGNGAGAGTPVAADAPLRRVDYVVMGATGNVFAIEGRLDDPAQRRAWVSVAEASRAPVDASDRLLAAANGALALRGTGIAPPPEHLLRPRPPDHGTPAPA